MLPHFCRCGVSFRGRGRDSEQCGFERLGRRDAFAQRQVF
jgi:hypothetical protein